MLFYPELTYIRYKWLSYKDKKSTIVSKELKLAIIFKPAY